MKLLLDEHFSHVIAQHLRSRGHDVVAVVERAELRELQDDEILAWAIGNGRAVVTENAGDFLRLHAGYLSRGKSHVGLILTTNARFPRTGASLGRLVIAIDELLQVLGSYDALSSATHWL